MITFDTEHPKIGIFRALQLGDLLCTIPAIRGLRNSIPQAEIVWIGLPWTTDFVHRFSHYIDRCIIFPGDPGLPEQPWNPEAWTVFVKQMQEEAFDLIIQMQGNGTIVNAMLQQLGARQLAGFHTDDCFMQSPLFMTYPNDGHEINRHLRLMQFLGIHCCSLALEFPVSDEEEEELDKLAPLAAQERYICVHPGSRGAWRQWPPVAFAALADICVQQGYVVYLTGTKVEAFITQEVADHMHYPCVNLTGKTSLGVIGALISHASLLIANCTGVSHIAAAFEVPSLVISMDGEPERWGPLNHLLHTTVDWTQNDQFDDVRLQLQVLLDSITHQKVY